jgi:hypothetical protein
MLTLLLFLLLVDDFPRRIFRFIIKSGIDISGIEIVKKGKTFFWSGKYHNDMNSRDTLVTELNTLADFNPVVPDAYQRCRSRHAG